MVAWHQRFAWQNENALRHWLYRGILYNGAEMTVPHRNVYVRVWDERGLSAVFTGELFGFNDSYGTNLFTDTPCEFVQLGPMIDTRMEDYQYAQADFIGSVWPHTRKFLIEGMIGLLTPCFGNQAPWHFELPYV